MSWPSLIITDFLSIFHCDFKYPKANLNILRHARYYFISKTIIHNTLVKRAHLNL